MGWYDAIAGKGIRGFALDCRGHGESAKPHEPEKYNRQAMARDVFALMLIPEAPADEKAAAHWQRSFDLIDAGVFDKEDLVVCEAIQRGLASGANDAMIVGQLEQNLQRFHSTVEAALR